MKAAVLGTGVIGAGWAARMLLHGWDVALWDPAPNALANVQQQIRQARTCLSALYDLPKPGGLRQANDVADAVKDADWVQESVPEQLEIKRQLLSSLADSVAESTIIASSTSGFRPSVMTEDLQCADRFIVCHPFNPVYLMPGVELVPSAATAKGVIDTATVRLQDIGMQPILVRKEIDAHIADRLLEAVWREALWLIKDGIATTEEIDNIIKSSFGLRWAQMGLFETYRLGGGDAGFRHFLEQFGPALQWPWSKLTDVPELDEALIEQIVSQSDAQTGAETTDQMIQRRDRNLVALLKVLREVDDGAGRQLNEFVRSRLDER